VLPSSVPLATLLSLLISKVSTNITLFTNPSHSYTISIIAMSSRLPEFLAEDMRKILYKQCDFNDDAMATYMTEMRDRDTIAVVQHAVDYHYSRQQLKAIALSIFALPLGLRVLFAVTIQNYSPSLKSHTRLQATPGGGSVYSAWRAGLLLPADVFSCIDKCAARGALTQQGT
jgi:hypothetical protein